MILIYCLRSAFPWRPILYAQQPSEVYAIIGCHVFDSKIYNCLLNYVSLCLCESQLTVLLFELPFLLNKRFDILCHGFISVPGYVRLISSFSCRQFTKKSKRRRWNGFSKLQSTCSDPFCYLFKTE